MPASSVLSRVGSSAPVRWAWARPAEVKVPQITVLFWVIKVLTTGTGEALSDFLAAHNLVVAAGVAAAGLVLGLVWQVRTHRFRPGVYWLAVSMVAVFGTMAADAVHVALGVPYVLTSLGYALAVGAVFAVWFAAEGTLDVHSIRTRRREGFYWAAVLATFALGTAVGDLSAITLGLGYLPSAILYAALIALPAIGWRLGLHPVPAFWSAYVLTRPLGASVADWLGKPAGRSGLGLGDGTVSLLSTVVIVALVALSSRQGTSRQGTSRQGSARHAGTERHP
jgi:uncharacterized membrane-anchored protein